MLANELCTVFDCRVVVLLLQIDGGEGLLIFQFFAEFDGFAVLAFLVELVTGIHDSRVCVGGGLGGLLSLYPPPEKILSLYPPPTLKTILGQKWENLARKCHFLEIF